MGISDTISKENIGIASSMLPIIAGILFLMAMYTYDSKNCDVFLELTLSAIKMSIIFIVLHFIIKFW